MLNTHVKEYLYSKWSECYDAGMPPMRLEQVVGYPVLEKNNITLYTAPNNIEERILSYGVNEVELEKNFGITYFFLNNAGQVVDNFENEKTFGNPMIVTLDQFANLHGHNFENLTIEPTTQGSYYI